MKSLLGKKYGKKTRDNPGGNSLQIPHWSYLKLPNLVGFFVVLFKEGVQSGQTTTLYRHVLPTCECVIAKSSS